MYDTLKKQLYKYRTIIGILTIVIGTYGTFKGITYFNFKETLIFLIIIYLGMKIKKYDIHTRRRDRFLYRHGHLVGGLLIFISIFGFLSTVLNLNIILFVTFGIAFYLGIISWNYDKKIDNEIRKEIKTYDIEKNNYINSIKPKGSIKHIGVNIYHQDLFNYLKINNSDCIYMFITNEKYIFFPETNIKDKPLYITNIDFKPKYYSKFDGYSDGISEYNNYYDNGSRYGYGYNMGTMSGTTKQIETSSYALITFVTPDLKKTFTMKFLDMNNNTVNYLKQYFKLNQVELKRLGIY